MTKNRKLIIQTTLFIGWLAASFYAVYYFIAGEFYFASWRFASTAFAWYALTIFPASLIVAYVFIRSHIADILQRTRILTSLAGILLIVSFTAIQWTTLTTRYGNIESFRFNDNTYIGLSDEQAQKLSVFEREQLFHEIVTANYDVIFKKIWTFDGLILFFAILFLKITHRKKIGAKA